MDVTTLRELFRNLEGFRAVYEDEGVDVIFDPDGFEWCLHDLEYLYRQLPILSLRQRQAIELYLVQNKREDEVAILMGTLPSNPVGMYATTGLQRLITMIEDGRFPRFRSDEIYDLKATG